MILITVMAGVLSIDSGGDRGIPRLTPLVVNMQGCQDRRERDTAKIKQSNILFYLIFIRVTWQENQGGWSHLSA